MVKIKTHEIPLVVQAHKLRSYFPDSKCSVRSNILIWKGYLTPSVLGSTYLIKVVYQRQEHPDVYVLEPKVLALAKGQTKLEHVYNTKKQQLCIYHRRAKEWNETKYIADTIIPWTSEWLLHYEYWAATGIWHGGGINHRI